MISAALSNKIDLALDSSNLGTSKVEEIAARNIRNQLVKYVSPVLKSLRDPPDNIEEYRALYGSLGPYLQQGVVRARQQSGGRSGSSSSAGPAAGARPQLSPSTVVVPGAGAATPGTPGTPGAGLGRVYLMSPGAVQAGARPQLSPGTMVHRQYSQPGPFQ